MRTITVLNGPNLNRLGQRNTAVYGTNTLDEIIAVMGDEAKQLGFEIQAIQSNSEGEIIDAIQRSIPTSAGIIINPGAYSHTSVAIRDALEGSPIPVIEVHISNIFAREEYRRHSYISEVVSGVVCGLGSRGYVLALTALVDLMKK